VIWFISLVVILALIGLVYWLARKSGKQQAEIKSLDHAIDIAERANEIDESVARMSNAELDQQLYNDKK